MDRVTEALDNEDYVFGVFLDFSKAFDTVDHAIFRLYINDLASVSKACFSILFADDSNIFISGKDVQVMNEKLNSDMENIRQWLCCNKLSLNVSKTHYMVCAPKNKHVDDLNIKIQNTNIERVSVTKFIGVMIDAQLSWKCHIEYTSKKSLNVLELSLKHGRN